MRLCFGTFARVLNRCRSNYINQVTFIGKLSTAIDSSTGYSEDAPAVTKLLSCKINFALGPDVSISNDTCENVVAFIAKNVSPFIEESRKAGVVLAILDIIRRDTCIDAEKKETFKRFLGRYKHELLQQCDIVFSDFIGRVLLYTIFGDVDNRVGQPYINEITNEYIYNILKEHSHKFQWNQDSQTLVILPIKIFELFEHSILEYQIKDFIERVDPTDRIHVDWFGQCEEFRQHIDNDIFMPYSQFEKVPGIDQIHQFVEILDAYITYIAEHIVPMVYADNGGNTDIGIPNIHEGNSFEFEFANQIQTYRYNLCCMYGNIRRCLIPTEYVTA